jgi:hypothetical protein
MITKSFCTYLSCSWLFIITSQRLVLTYRSNFFNLSVYNRPSRGTLQTLAFSTSMGVLAFLLDLAFLGGNKPLAIA